jgi:formamidopyrimidine-DNA glycosylase
VRKPDAPECNGFPAWGCDRWLPHPSLLVYFAVPELAEVDWYRKRWDVARGGPIVDLALHTRMRVFRETNTRELQRHLLAATYLGSERRGKRMLFKFSGENWLGIHLGMTGKIHVAPLNFRPAKHDHLVLYQRERALVFTDPRQFGQVRFHYGTDEPDWWKSDAPEIVSSEFNREFLGRFLERHRRAPIKAVLLLQTGFPGIGNWMADEILWRARILPSRRARSLREHERAALLRETKFVVRRSLETLGKDFSDPPRGWLIHERWSRTGVCPRHRTPLRHATIGARTTAWCPRCQR